MLTLNGSGFSIEDTLGRRIFDSSERMFHVTNTVTGTKNITAKASGVTSHSFTSITHTLGSCNAAATHLIGAFKIIFPGSVNPSGIPAGKWFNAGGTYIHWFDGTTMTSAGWANNPTQMSELGVWAQYTPRIASGSFLLDEDVSIWGYTSGGLASSYELYAFNLQYHFKAGLFTI